MKLIDDLCRYFTTVTVYRKLQIKILRGWIHEKPVDFD